ncbi:uncharacterized protein RSE6_04051 [Rhynchosporium secalis]|uniref:2EXR domain-containing protein n=1 Tax=Rhynchosporium secalis TaxID=38038 RepID=A0A1E1M4A2_RHYSE|nr:uncharacterized protein RSE6_04051 [Rhynchosporium secalis]
MSVSSTKELGDLAIVEVNSAALSLTDSQNTPDVPSFPILPSELRTEIWKLALPGPREIMINNHGAGRAEDKPVLGEGASAIPTPLLHTNQESRYIARKIYTAYTGFWEGPPIYFNPRIDVLHFDRFIFLSPYFIINPQLSRQILFHVQHIVVSGTRGDVASFSVPMVKYIGRDMQSLKTIRVTSSLALAITAVGGQAATGMTLEDSRVAVRYEKQLLEAWTKENFGHLETLPVATIDAGEFGFI